MRFFIKIFFFFFSLSAFATPNEDLIRLLNNVNSMQADFTQSIADAQGKKLNKTTGRMAFSRPGKFRWDTLQPNKQLIVTDGKKLWMYDPDLDQVTIRNLTQETGETPALLLSHNNTTLENNFRIEALQKNSDTQWFSLTPKNKDSMFASIKLGFTHQQISQMQLQDHLGHLTNIQFNQVVINPTLPSSLFTFKPPANVDVIDETRR